MIDPVVSPPPPSADAVGSHDPGRRIRGDQIHLPNVHPVPPGMEYLHGHRVRGRHIEGHHGRR